MISEKDRHVLEYWHFPEEEEARNDYSLLLSRIQKIYDEILVDQTKPVKLDVFLEDFIKLCDSHSWGLLRVFSDGQIFRKNPSSTALNSALVAYFFAKEYQWEPNKIRVLLRGALLHEVGMLFVPFDILNKQGKVTDGERAIIEAHPTATTELVQKWMEPPEVVAMALEHHEDWDGHGYPRGLKGSLIHPYAQLLGLIQSFVAMSTQREYRNSMVGYLAIKQILGLQETRFSSLLIKDFINCFGLHPPGSVVLLSDGSIARVMEPNLGDPLKPLVRILIDSVGTEYRKDNGALMELNLAKKLFIARPINLLDLVALEQN